MKTLLTRRTMLLLPLLAQSSAWSAQEAAPAVSGPRPPAPTLKPAGKSPLKVDSRGFIHRWRVQDPIPVSGRLTQNDVEQVLREKPWSAEAAAQAPVHDTQAYNFNLYHFAWARSKPTSNVLFWAETTVDVAAPLDSVRLAIGSNAASAWWLDGERVIALYNDRQAVIDDGVSRRLKLAAGRHVIRAAIINGGGATDFCARFLSEDGSPVTSLWNPAL